MNGASMTGEKLNTALLKRLFGENFRTTSKEYQDIIARIDSGTPALVINAELIILENTGRKYEVRKPSRGSTGWGW